MTRSMHWLLIFLLTIALGACNTLAGAGEDLEHAGDEIQEAADG